MCASDDHAEAVRKPDSSLEESEPKAVKLAGPSRRFSKSPAFPQFHSNIRAKRVMVAEAGVA